MKELKPTCWLRPNGKTVASRKKALKRAKHGEEMVPMVPFSKARHRLCKMEQELCDMGDYQQRQQLVIHDLNAQVALLRGMLTAASGVMEQTVCDLDMGGIQPAVKKLLQTIAKNVDEYLRNTAVQLPESLTDADEIVDTTLPAETC